MREYVCERDVVSKDSLKSGAKRIIVSISVNAREFSLRIRIG